MVHESDIGIRVYGLGFRVGWGYIRIMEKKTEATVALTKRCHGLLCMHRARRLLRPNWTIISCRGHTEPQSKYNNGPNPFFTERLTLHTFGADRYQVFIGIPNSR